MLVIDLDYERKLNCGNQDKYRSFQRKDVVMADKCECGSTPVLIFACSGGSDVGELSDRAARALGKEICGKMYCLAGIGGDVSGIVESTKSADDILVIDGCALHCAKKTLERAGFNQFEHVDITAYGFVKGKTPVDDSSVRNLVGIIRKKTKRA